jgi:hypothetical protein
VERDWNLKAILALQFLYVFLLISLLASSFQVMGTNEWLLVSATTIAAFVPIRSFVAFLISVTVILAACFIACLGNNMNQALLGFMAMNLVSSKLERLKLDQDEHKRLNSFLGEKGEREV